MQTTCQKYSPDFWEEIHFCRHNFADSGIIVYLESLIKNKVDRSFNIKFRQKPIMLITFWFTLVGACSANTIESKGRINWERLNIEEKKINLENRNLQFKIIKLQMEACKEIYGADLQAKTACVKKYMLQLSEIFENKQDLRRIR